MTSERSGQHYWIGHFQDDNIWVEMIEFITSLLSLFQIYRSQRWTRNQQVEGFLVSLHIKESSKFLQWNLEYSSRNPESLLRLEFGIQVPPTNGPESMVRNPVSKTALNSLTWGHLVKLWRKSCNCPIFRLQSFTHWLKTKTFVRPVLIINEEREDENKGLQCTDSAPFVEDKRLILS